VTGKEFRWREVSRRELLIVLVILALNLVLLLALMPAQLKGQDTPKFIEIALTAQFSGFWSDPSAFDGNYWAVGYPTFLAMIFKVFGFNLRLVQILQVFIALCLPIFAWLLTRHTTPRIRIATLIVVAISPATYFLAHLGGYEILLSWFMCLSLVILWGVGGSPNGPRFWRRGSAGICSGLALGLAFMVQNKALIVVPVLIYLAIKWGWPTVGAFIVGLCVPVAFWAYRNSLVLGSFSPFGKNAEINAWIGNNPNVTTGGFMEPPPLPPGASSYWNATVNFWASQPEFTFQILGRKIARLLEPAFIYPEYQLPTGSTLLLHTFSFLFSVLILFAFAAYIFGRVWTGPPTLPKVGPLAAFYLLFMAAHLPFLAEARFRTPLEPVLAAVAVPTVFYLIAQLRAKTSRSILTRVGPEVD